MNKNNFRPNTPLAPKFEPIKLTMLLKLSIFSFLLFGYSQALCQDFENKQDAVDFLNSSNIWVSGFPEYTLDQDNGILSVFLKSDAGSVTTNVPLADVRTKLDIGDMVLLEINCQQGEMCVVAQTNDTRIEVDGLTLLMSSTFDDGTYYEDYKEQGAKIASAFDYLIDGYKD